MKRIQLPDLWHLEKALTAAAMMAVVLVIVAGFVTLSERYGWVTGSVFALIALTSCIWVIIRYVPLSEYRRHR